MANESTTTTTPSSNHSAVTFYEPHPDAHPIRSALKKRPVIVPSSSGDLSDNDDGSGDEGDDEGEARRYDKERESVRRKKSLKWDEGAIEEHDQLRGTRMKIDEPDTPYSHYDSHEEDGGSTANSGHIRTPPEDENQKPSPLVDNNLALHWDHIKNKLNTVAAVRDCYPSSPSASSHDGGGGYASASSLLTHSDSEDMMIEKRRNKRADQEFKMHRKMHYNEMEELRKWKAQQHDESDEEENAVEIQSNGKKVRTVT